MSSKDGEESGIKRLCHPYYVRKNVKRTKKSADASVEERTPVAVPVARRLMPRPTATMAPQVDFVDGRIVIRESSLVVGAEPTALLEEGEALRPASYSSYRVTSVLSSAKWGVEETRTFYDALRQVGQDYSLMQSFLPGRTRKQLKMKFFR